MKMKISRAWRLLFNREPETTHGRAVFQSMETSSFLLVSPATECHQLVARLHVGLMVSERLPLRELRANEVGVSWLYGHTSGRTQVI